MYQLQKDQLNCSNTLNLIDFNLKLQKKITIKSTPSTYEYIIYLHIYNMYTEVYVYRVIDACLKIRMRMNTLLNL